MGRGLRGRKTAVLAVIIVALVGVSAAAAVYLGARGGGTGKTTIAYSPFIEEYPMVSPFSQPDAVAVDSAGNVWTVLQNQSSLAELSPGNGSVHMYKVPLPDQGSLLTWGIALDQARRAIWVADETDNLIWRFDIDAKAFTSFALATRSALPYQIALDQAGNAWFTEFSGNKLGTVSPNGTVVERQIPLPSGEPTGLAVDSRGRVWFNLIQLSASEAGNDNYYIGAYFRGSFTFYNLTGKVDTPVGIAVDANGTVWVTQHGASLITRFDPSTGSATTISTSIPPIGESLPYFVAVDQNSGRVWFNEHYGNSMGSFDPATGQMVEYSIPSGSASYQGLSGALTMALSSSGTPWFAEVYTGKLGQVDDGVPLGLGIKVLGLTPQGHVGIGGGSSLQLRVQVEGPSGQNETLGASVGSLGSPFVATFSPQSGTGNFSSTLSLVETQPAHQSYAVTVSVKTPTLVVSQVVYVDA